MLLRDNTARARQIISIFWIMLGITIVNIGSLVWQYSLITNAQSDLANVDMQAINTSDTARQIILIVSLVVTILAIIFFIMWFRRAYYNLHQLPWHNARYTEGWAAGSWFVPIIWFWWPYQIMVDIWKGTQNALRERLGEPQPSTIVGWWWACYLITDIYGKINARFNRGADELDELIVSTKLDFIGEIISIPAIVLVIRIVQRTSYFERELLIHSQTPADSIFSANYRPPVETAETKLEN